MGSRFTLPALLGLSLSLVACAGHSPEERQQAYREDMLQAKLLIASAEPVNYGQADALLEKARGGDAHGEVAFYQALLKIRRHAPAGDILPLLERAAGAGQPYAVALLYRIYSESLLGQPADAFKAEQYRQAYADLDVAKSGYPGFERAQQIVQSLLQQQPQR